MKPLLFLFVFCCCLPIQVYLQESGTSLAWGEFHYGVQSPLSAMHDRFGTYFNLGARTGLILDSGLSLGVDYHFLFGSNVKEDVLFPLRRSDGSIIAESLSPSLPLLKLRGYALQLMIGTWIRSKDKNQGWWLRIGPGFLQHKILIQDDVDRLAQLRGSLRKGYDRLSNGFGAAASVGYLYISPNRQITLFAALDAGLYSVVNRRGYNIDTQMVDDQPTTHGTFGLSLGWVIPLFLN